MTNDEIAELAATRIERAIRRNLPVEIVVVVILVAVAVVAIFLLLSGTFERRWELLASGASCAFAVGWPVSYLLKLRKFNIILQTLPEIIRLSDAEGRKDLVFRMVDKLIQKL